MKICILTDAWTPIWGGGQEHIWQITSRLVKNYDCQVDILVPNIAGTNDKKYPGNEISSQGKIRLLRIGPAFRFPSLLGRGVNLLESLSWMLKNSYDVYHSHSSAAILLPFVKLFHPKGKFIYTVHGAGVELVGGGVLNRFGLSKMLVFIWQRLIYDYSWDALLTAARSTIAKPVRAKVFSVIGNGVDVAAYDKLRTTKNIKTFKITWVGRMTDPVKGVRYLQEAVKGLKQKYPQLVLNLVTGRPHEEVMAEYKSSDLFVLPSLSEGLPLTLLEAMAAKLPVVVTDVGDCRRVVESAKCGLFVPPGDMAALATAIAQVVNSRKTQKWGDNGYRFATKEYSWDKIAKVQYEIYKKVLGN